MLFSGAPIDEYLRAYETKARLQAAVFNPKGAMVRGSRDATERVLIETLKLAPIGLLHNDGIPAYDPMQPLPDGLPMRLKVIGREALFRVSLPDLAPLPGAFKGGAIEVLFPTRDFVQCRVQLDAWIREAQARIDAINACLEPYNAALVELLQRVLDERRAGG